MKSITVVKKIPQNVAGILLEMGGWLLEFFAKILPKFVDKISRTR
jgi:hypothetical protein